MDAIADEPAVRIRTVPRRVMVRCPSTEVPVNTGYEPAAIANIQREPQMLADCAECGQDHTWCIEDAFLGP
jgi:hypothetical protein